jgi:hypothetical protein
MGSALCNNTPRFKFTGRGTMRPCNPIPTPALPLKGRELTSLGHSFTRHLSLGSSQHSLNAYFDAT